MNNAELKLFKEKGENTALLTLEAEHFAPVFRPDGTVLLIIDLNERQIAGFIEGIFNEDNFIKLTETDGEEKCQQLIALG